jgi:MarR family transcriptional regulator, temperature-dependent positive regulator of motility
MERAGLLERRRDDRDGRVVRIRLTPLGRSLEPRCRSVLHGLSEVLRAGMSEADLRHTKRLLRRLTETLRRAERQRLRSPQAREATGDGPPPAGEVRQPLA